MTRSRVKARDLLSWPLAPVLLITAGLMLAGVPEDFLGEDLEGPTVLPLGEEHALQLSNLLAILLLIAGAAGLILGAIHYPAMVMSSISKRPLPAALLTLQLVAGIALLLLSGLSTTLVWWASGTFLSVTALLGLTAVLKQGIP